MSYLPLCVSTDQVVVNPLGSPVTPSGRHLWAAPFEMAGEFGALGPDPARGFRDLPASRKAAAMAGQGGADSPQAGGNTTIAVVATDAVLDKAQCHRMAVAAHDGLARAIGEVMAIRNSLMSDSRSPTIW